MANDIYQPLQSNQVRFLRLLPGRRKLAAQLELSIARSQTLHRVVLRLGGCTVQIRNYQWVVRFQAQQPMLQSAREPP